MSIDEPAGLWFVYRSPGDGPLSRRVRRLAIRATPGYEAPEPALLVWFQSHLGRAHTAADPRALLETALGGPVHGLGALFEKVKDKELTVPKTMAALERLLREQLGVDGGADNLRITDHSLRVLTTDENDDEQQIAYFFFDDEMVREQPDRVAFLLLDDPHLPAGDAAGKFRAPVKPTSLLPAGAGTGTTFACLFTSDQPLPGQAVAFSGVRLPELAAYLRGVKPPVSVSVSVSVSVEPEATADAEAAAGAEGGIESWPIELRLLRAQLDEDDRSLAPALTRCAAYPLRQIVGTEASNRLGVGELASARAEFATAADGLEHRGDPEKTIVHESPHLAVLCAHDAGYQQWILFDDRWAAAQPDLAASMLRYATAWDPFVWRKTRKRNPKDVAADKVARAWEAAIGDRTEADAEPYQMSGDYSVGALLQHAKLGLGAVEATEPTKIQVLFQDARRTLVHRASV